MTPDQIRELIAALQAMLVTEPVKIVGPDEIYLPVTGNVFPKPIPNTATEWPLNGELFPGYVMRVGAKIGRSTSATGSLFQGSDHLFVKFGGYKADGSNWPEAADFYFNARAYQTEKERAEADAGVLAWSRWRPAN
jgi:hypothetical protein